LQVAEQRWEATSIQAESTEVLASALGIRSTNNTDLIVYLGRWNYNISEDDGFADVFRYKSDDFGHVPAFAAKLVPTSRNEARE
jgi:hypothetical protein